MQSDWDHLIWKDSHKGGWEITGTTANDKEYPTLLDLLLVLYEFKHRGDKNVWLLAKAPGVIRVQRYPPREFVHLCCYLRNGRVWVFSHMEPEEYEELV